MTVPYSSRPPPEAAHYGGGDFDEGFDGGGGIGGDEEDFGSYAVEQPDGGGDFNDEFEAGDEYDSEYGDHLGDVAAPAPGEEGIDYDGEDPNNPSGGAEAPMDYDERGLRSSGPESGDSGSGRGARWCQIVAVLLAFAAIVGVAVGATVGTWSSSELPRRPPPPPPPPPADEPGESNSTESNSTESNSTESNSTTPTPLQPQPTQPQPTPSPTVSPAPTIDLAGLCPSDLIPHEVSLSYDDRTEALPAAAWEPGRSLIVVMRDVEWSSIVYQHRFNSVDEVGYACLNVGDSMDVSGCYTMSTLWSFRGASAGGGTDEWGVRWEVRPAPGFAALDGSALDGAPIPTGIVESDQGEAETCTFTTLTVDAFFVECDLTCETTDGASAGGGDDGANNATETEVVRALRASAQ